MLLTFCSQLSVVLEKNLLLLLKNQRSIIYKSVSVKRNFFGSKLIFSCKDKAITLFVLCQLTILSSFYKSPLFPAVLPSYFYLQSSPPLSFLHCSPSHYYTQKYTRAHTQKTLLELELYSSQLQHLFYLCLLLLSRLVFIVNYLGQGLFIIVTLAIHCQGNQPVMADLLTQIHSNQLLCKNSES